jgi:hypothetical protein
MGEGEGWFIRHLVIETREWLLGKKVLGAPDWIGRVFWRAQTVAIDLTRTVMAASPEYGPSIWVTRLYETGLHKYYGRTPYWESKNLPSAG